MEGVQRCPSHFSSILALILTFIYQLLTFFPPRHYLFPSPLLSFVLVVAKQQAAPRNDLLIGSATHMGPWQKSD